MRFNPTNGQLQIASSGGGGSSPLTTKGDLYTYTTIDARLPVGTNGQLLSSNSATITGLEWVTAGGTGTVTSVGVTGNNGIGVSGSPITTSGSITLSLGAITPSSINSVVLSGSSTPTLVVTGTSSISGTNTGDQTITLTGDVTGSGTGSFATAIATGVIVNADINASAAIAVSKLAALTTGRAVITDGSGFVSAATTTATEIGYVNGVTSSIQTQINGKQATGNYITALTGDVTASGPGSVASTLATVNANVGSFTNANITVNAKGLITAAANGTAGTGDVVGPSSSFDGDFALFDGTTGKLLKEVLGAGYRTALSAWSIPSIITQEIGDGPGSPGLVIHGVTTLNSNTVPSSNIVGISDSQTLTNKTLTTPTIASFANANHNHTNSAGGGQLTDAALSGPVTVSKGGTGQTTLTIAYGLLAAGTTAAILVGGGPSALPVWTTATGSGAPVRGTSPTITTPVIDQFGTTSGLGAAWTSITPTVTSSAGTFTSVSCQAYYKQIGKTVNYNGVITITTVGTATSGIFIPLPVTAARNFSGTVSGRELNVTGKGMSGVNDTTARIYLTYYDNTSPSASGNAIAFSIAYEAA